MSMLPIAALLFTAFVSRGEPVITVQSERVFPVYHKGDLSDVTASVALDVDSSQAVLGYTHVNADGEERAFEIIQQGFVKGETVSVSVPLDVASFGPQEINLIVKDTDGELCRETVKYTVVPDNTGLSHNSGDFIFGIQEQLYWYVSTAAGWMGLQDMDPVVKVARDLGVTDIRSMIAWQRIEAVEGQYDWENVDYLFDLYEKYGLKQCHTFAYTPEWSFDRRYPDGEYDPKKPPYLPDYTNFVHTFTSRYLDRDVIHVYEIWNEPNWRFWDGEVSDFVELATAGKSVLDDLVPEDAIVVSGGYAQRSNHDKIQAIAEGTVSAYTNAAFHWHGTFNNEISYYEAVVGILTNAGYQTSQLINTESGMHAISEDRQMEQAWSDVKKTAFQFSQGIMGVFCFKLLETPPEYTDSIYEKTYGIIDLDHIPKPAYAGYAALIHMLAGARPVAACDAHAAVSSAQFRKGSDLVVMLWNNEQGSTASVQLSGATATGAVYDFYANQTGTLAPGAGLSVDYEPVYVVFPDTAGPVDVNVSL